MNDDQNLNTESRLSSGDHLKRNYPESRFKTMSPGKKLELSLQLYFSARELKRSWLKQQHPDWSDAFTEIKVREIFLYART